MPPLEFENCCWWWWRWGCWNAAAAADSSRWAAAIAWGRWWYPPIKPAELFRRLIRLSAESVQYPSKRIRGKQIEHLVNTFTLGFDAHIPANTHAKVGHPSCFSLIFSNYFSVSNSTSIAGENVYATLSITDNIYALLLISMCLRMQQEILIIVYCLGAVRSKVGDLTHKILTNVQLVNIYLQFFRIGTIVWLFAANKSCFLVRLINLLPILIWLIILKLSGALMSLAFFVYTNTNAS